MQYQAIYVSNLTSVCNRFLRSYSAIKVLKIIVNYRQRVCKQIRYHDLYAFFVGTIEEMDVECIYHA